MSKGKGYEGKVSNKGAQKVEAPISQAPAKKGKTNKGKDLRSGNGGK